MTLQFYLGLKTGVDHPSSWPLEPLDAGAQPAEWPPDWDGALYSIFAFSEFVEKVKWREFADAIPKSFLEWRNSDQNAAQAFLRGEIETLKQYMMQDRERYLAEIIAQHDGAPDCWIALLGLTRTRKPWTRRVLSFAARVGELVAMHSKLKYKRARPSQVAPGLMPPFGPPAHPSFPSGHATQSYMIAYCLAEATRSGAPVAPTGSFKEPDSAYAKQLLWLANRISKNREIGGFHYPSDSEAGKNLAQQAFGEIAGRLAQTAAPFGEGSIAELFDKAKAEWIQPPR